MPKLSNQQAWTENFRAAIVKTLGLTDEEKAKLFADGGSIQITKPQGTSFKELVASWKEPEDDEDVTATPNEDEGDEGEDVTATPDTGDKDSHESADEASLIDVSIAGERDRNAIDVGKALSKETNAVLVAGYLAKEELAINPLLLRTAFRKDFGDKIATWPMPGSYLKKDDKGSRVMIGTGDTATEITFSGNEEIVWDKYKYQTVNVETGNTVTRSSSFFEKVVEASLEGTKRLDEYDLLTTAFNSFKKDGPKCPATYEGLTRPQVVRRRKLAKARLKTMENNTRAAIKLDKQCMLFDDLKLVGYRFETETVKGEEKYVNRNEPVQVFSITRTVNGNKETIKEGEPSNLSIGAFNRFDVRQAIVKAGGKDKVTLAHLQATVKRTPAEDKKKKQETKDEWSKHEIENVRQFENVTSSMVSYLTKGDGDVVGKRMQLIENRMAESDGADMLVILGDLASALDDWWTRHEKAYRIERNNRNKVAESEKTPQKAEEKKVA